jgi:SAM-dependent methyltransferase
MLFVVKVDFGRTSEDYARHRAGFPASFFDVLAQRGLVRPGLRALDLGTGTGTILRGLEARSVRTVGLDPSAAQLAAAIEIASQEGLAARVVRARAEALPFADRTFDLVAAGQCWHWFEGVRAGREARRVLKPDAWFVLAGFDWLGPPGSVGELTNDLVHETNAAWKPWVSADLAPGWIADLREAGFDELETFEYDVDVTYSHASWRGRIRACSGMGASLPSEQVDAFDERFARILAQRFPEDPLHVVHRVFALIGRNGGKRIAQTASLG